MNTNDTRGTTGAHNVQLTSMFTDKCRGTRDTRGTTDAHSVYPAITSNMKCPHCHCGGTFNEEDATTNE